MTRPRALLVALALGCGGAGEPEQQQAPEPASAVEAVDTSIATPADTLRQPGALRGVDARAATGRPAPDERPFETTIRTTAERGYLSRQIGMQTFDIALRSDVISQPACTSCHLPTGDIVTAERTADAHANIQPAHPAEGGATCITCHAPDNVAALMLRTGETVGLDQAYRLCAQCHFRQVDEWRGGAHGKRLDGWQGRRVIMGCADCHDPHRPAITQRIPFPGPRLPPKGHEQP
ncbi:MAG: hypothetical protein WEF86_16950 [Gemmatimonadota bacterium]